MRIAICDDEKIFQEQLQKQLEKILINERIEIALFSSGEALIKNYSFGEFYDIVFMDIEMEGLNGIEVVKQIRRYERHEKIIFLSSHRDYAIEGYEVSAVRYLLKPINAEKLREAIEECKQLLEQKDTFVVHSNEGDVVICMDDLLYCEAMRNDLLIYIGKNKNGILSTRIVKVRMTLSEIQDKLKNKQFFKCHRSYIVNIKRVVTYNAQRICLEDNSEIPMSRGKMKELQKYLIKGI